jgi:hypothetical protein
MKDLNWLAKRDSGADLVRGASGFFSNIVYGDPSWDLKRFNLERDTKAAFDKLAKAMNTTETNLQPFQERGGKLIMYQGWSDGAVPPLAAIEYYQSVVNRWVRRAPATSFAFSWRREWVTAAGESARIVSARRRSPKETRNTVSRPQWNVGSRKVSLQTG